MKAFILLVTLTVPLFLSAQISLNQWMTISPISDSSHQNRNACLQGTYKNTIVFWDQELDPSTTQLCYRHVNPSMGDIQVALLQSGVKFTHPKIIELSQGSSSNEFIVIYQTNEGNDVDLKYINFRNDGTISEPTVLSELPGDDINLCIYGLTIAWENSGRIFLSDYQSQNEMFSEPVTVETTGGFSPAFSNSWLQYLTTENDNTRLKAKQYYYIQGNWVLTDSASKVFTGQCSGLSSSQPWFGMNLCMQQNLANETSGIIIYDDLFESQYFHSQLFNYTQPVICDYVIGVKNDFYFLAYVSDSLSQNEIFAKAPIGLNTPVNISQWPGGDRNPRFFVNFPETYFIRVNLLWESDREGFSTIYHSHFDYLFGGTKENSKPENLLVSPCPFERETTISFQSAAETKFRIIDLQGREIKSLTPQIADNGWQKAVWDGTNQQGKRVPAGSYLVVAGMGNAMQSRIIIKN